MDLFQILNRRGQGSIHLIKILTLSFYISCYPQFFCHYCKKLATSWTNVSIMIQSDQTPLSTLISWIKEKKEKARIIFLPCIFLSMLINNSFIFFDHILRSRTCYQTHFGTELKSILLSLSFLLKYGKLVENCESKFSRRANKGNATNFARACKYKRYNV